MIEEMFITGAQLQNCVRADATPFECSRHLSTPFLLITPEDVRKNIIALRRDLRKVSLFYAVKANSDPRIISTIDEMQVGFEISSPGEAIALLDYGISPERIVCFHPVKSPAFIRLLHQQGIDVMAADSAYELEKIAECAPGSRVVIRVIVPNEGSIVPLNRKFGVAPDKAVPLMQYALTRGLRPYGITIHTGSQCENLETWIAALRICRSVFQQFCDNNIALSLISIGGGLPAPYCPNSLPVEFIGEVIDELLGDLRDANDVTISAEPGRIVVASAGTLFTTVIGLAERSDGLWAYIDAGVYQGIFEACESGGGIRYPINVEKPELPLFAYNIGGPTCDSFDLPFQNIQLPELHIGDRLAIRFTGAYSTVISTTFNGFPGPVIHYAEDLLQ